MSRTLYCYDCNKKIAVIIKGSVQKGASGLCDGCVDKRNKQKAADAFKNINNNDNPFKDLLGGLDLDNIFKS